jgi:putative membrane protein
MMMQRTLLAAAVGVLVLGTAAVLPADDTTPLDAASFVAKAGVGSQFEVKSSQLAPTRSQRAEIKRFAETMVTDHMQLSQDLSALAAKKALTIPGELDRKHQEIVQRLMSAQGDAFDRDYVKAQIDAHQAAVKFFEQAARDLNDPDLKAFAAKYLPKLREHLKAAQELGTKSP